MTTNSDDYLTIEDAAKAFGISRTTLWRRVKELDVPVYQNLRDKRIRLLKRSELEQAFAPVIVQAVRTPRIATPVAVSRQENGR